MVQCPRVGARIRAYGKVNFTLDVLGSEGGYHLIDSLVCTIGLYDLVRARRREDGGVRLLMQGMPYELPPEKNNAWRAARAFCAAFGAGGADITIEKRHVLIQSILYVFHIRASGEGHSADRDCHSSGQQGRC